jgi:dihydrofolate reductase
MTVEDASARSSQIESSSREKGDVMGKVLVHATLSLDGFMAGPNDEMDWVFKRSVPDKVGDEVMKTTGAVVLGKRTSDISLKNNQLPYGAAVKVPQFVITHKGQDPVTIDGLKFIFVTQGIESAIEQAKSAAGEKNVSLLGASIDQQCLTTDLADEIVIHLVPVLLGEGIRLFDHLGAEPIELERSEVVSTTGMTSLRFRVMKS